MLTPKKGNSRYSGRTPVPSFPDTLSFFIIGIYKKTKVENTVSDALFVKKKHNPRFDPVGVVGVVGGREPRVAPERPIVLIRISYFRVGGSR